MKKAMIKRTPPIRSDEFLMTAQLVDTVLVLNIWDGPLLEVRHCIDTVTNEYGTFVGDTYRDINIRSALDIVGLNIYGDFFSGRKVKKKISRRDDELVRALIPGRSWRSYESVLELIEYAEYLRSQKMRSDKEYRRLERVKAEMNKVPAIPEGITEWLDNLTGNKNYLLKRAKDVYSCTACGRTFARKELSGKNKDMLNCLGCGNTVQLLTRKKSVFKSINFALAQPIDDEVSVVRHFSAYIDCNSGMTKRISFEENIRLMMYKKTGKIMFYYEQYNDPGKCIEGAHNFGDFDNKSNIANKRMGTGYLFDGGIEEALKNTPYERWSRLFVQMSAAGVMADYNRLMACGDSELVGLTEMLFRNRFWEILKDTSEAVSLWNYEYTGPLGLSGSDIRDVFQISDKQAINRIRDKNWPILARTWLRWSEMNKKRLSDKVLNWLITHDISPEDLKWIKCRFSIEQAMNYLERQQKESYKGKKIHTIINQYEDYMDMCKKLHKDMSDEMVYRPRDLKLRHDEAVAELAARAAEIQAEEYEKKFGEAENVLKEIKDKFEYEGDIFLIKVPDRIADIVSEGRALHHCAGATDRYFDRIKQHETYICFLRKKESPDTPFYTIEVEPGGTIRQHRGMYDEEPEIEVVKPFLREWQQVIRKRMSEEDKARETVSIEKRLANIEDLKAKNNTRVLKGLMEDFMEAVG